MEQVTRPIMWNVLPWMETFLYVGAGLALFAAFVRLYRRYRVWRQGRPADVTFSLQASVQRTLSWILGGGKMPRDTYASVMHSLILWGFIILFIGTTLVFLEHDTPLHFFYGTFYLGASFVIDLGGLTFLAGLGMALYRRYVQKTARLRSSGWIDLMVALMIAIAVTGFTLEGLRISVTLPSFEKFSFVGYTLALALRGLISDPTKLATFHRINWIAHAALCIAFFALATTYFFRHVVISIMSVMFRPSRPAGALRPYEIAADAAPSGKVSDLTWKDLLDADACTTCGRCASVCPASTAGKALDPRAVVLKLSDLISRQVRTHSAKAPSALDTITDQELWDCTTCGACVRECPVDIEVFDKIIDLRRQLVETGRVPESARTCLEGLDQRHNPWDYPPGQRTAWAEAARLPVATPEKKPEWIYWIGCAGAYESAGQSIAKATTEILCEAKVDFAVLGSEERCTGDPARRLGDETLFQKFREKNLATLRRHGVRKIVTHCPHCLNTLKNEYQNGTAEFEVVHHSQLLNQLVAEEKIRLDKTFVHQAVTFHDPCYLGRHNGEFAAPRSVIDRIPGVQRIELKRSREKSFCCGGGGGQMWLASSGSQRVENVRLKEIQQSGAKVVATACPFCKIMLESAGAAAGQQEAIQVQDISELVRETMQR